MPKTDLPTVSCRSLYDVTTKGGTARECTPTTPPMTAIKCCSSSIGTCTGKAIAACYKERYMLNGTPAPKSSLSMSAHLYKPRQNDNKAHKRTTVGMLCNRTRATSIFSAQAYLTQMTHCKSMMLDKVGNDGKRGTVPSECVSVSTHRGVAALPRVRRARKKSAVSVEKNDVSVTHAGVLPALHRPHPKSKFTSDSKRKSDRQISALEHAVPERPTIPLTDASSTNSMSVPSAEAHPMSLESNADDAFRPSSAQHDSQANYAKASSASTLPSARRMVNDTLIQDDYTEEVETLLDAGSQTKLPVQITFVREIIGLPGSSAAHQTLQHKQRHLAPLSKKSTDADYSLTSITHKGSIESKHYVGFQGDRWAALLKQHYESIVIAFREDIRGPMQSFSYVVQSIDTEDAEKSIVVEVVLSIRDASDANKADAILGSIPYMEMWKLYGLLGLNSTRDVFEEQLVKRLRSRPSWRRKALTDKLQQKCVHGMPKVLCRICKPFAKCPSVPCASSRSSYAKVNLPASVLPKIQCHEAPSSRSLSASPGQDAKVMDATESLQSVDSRSSHAPVGGRRACPSLRKAVTSHTSAHDGKFKDVTSMATACEPANSTRASQVLPINRRVAREGSAALPDKIDAKST